jgi:hypothetical protein
MASDQRRATAGAHFVEERIAQTLDAISDQIALVFRLGESGQDPVKAVEQLHRLEGDLSEWRVAHEKMSEDAKGDEASK